MHPISMCPDFLKVHGLETTTPYFPSGTVGNGDGVRDLVTLGDGDGGGLFSGLDDGGHRNVPVQELLIFVLGDDGVGLAAALLQVGDLLSTIGDWASDIFRVLLMVFFQEISLVDNLSSAVIAEENEVGFVQVSWDGDCTDDGGAQ
ncbi:hypothetical protein EYC80_007090 [Monilinia laxa]|uniref:Uncharacterized protein n=1 Tax=Monilinia laxa TaxID=61186 RepID=A0A5N6K057_MONLA|nr:hypothetical protein EYC80_007090 [Monilinia laxa]